MGDRVEDDSKGREGTGFRVIDRRGQADAPSEAEPPTTADAPSEAKPVPTPAAEPEAKPVAAAAHEEARGPIDFVTFVLSLGSTAAIQLGDLPEPETGERRRDLPMAKETIDLLGMLQEKTRGNLSHDEARFLEGLLYDLRLRFVEALPKPPP